MRSDLISTACLAAAVACSPAKVDSLLPMDGAGPAYVAAHCAVPVRITRRTVGEGDDAQTLVDHRCLDSRSPQRLILAVEFNEATGQTVDLELGVSERTRSEADASFQRHYAAFVEPYIAASQRDAARTFAMEPVASTSASSMDDTADRTLVLSRRVSDTMYASRVLTITRHIRGVQ